MSAIVIGKAGKRGVHLDIDVLLRTRLLIQGNSGSGKSWLVRRIAEQVFGKVPTVIIDPEGEYATLRERYGYVLVGKGGETPADPRSAPLVAKRLLELNASAVCDIYELKAPERHRWVKNFLEALVDAPKSLWHPTLVIVDEAHVFCPEKGQGESEAAGAMVDLATRGRKRGYASVFSTQRLGKLSKNAAAELLNVLIGQTFIDIDQHRAAEVLGVSRSDQRDFFREMKVTDPGDFWALGRAITKDRILVKVGHVQTTHPEPGSTKHAVGVPPPPARIKHLLPKLADLPKEAEQKAKNESELRKEIQTLRIQLKAAQKATPVVKPLKPSAPVTTVKKVEIPIWKPRDLVRLEKAMAHADSAAGKIQNEVPNLRGFADQIRETLKKFEQVKRGLNTAPPPPTSRVQLKESRTPKKPVLTTSRSAPGDGNGTPLTQAERGILKVLAQYPDDGCVIGKIALLACYRITGGFRNALSSLRSKKLIVGQNLDVMMITQDGIDALGSNYEPLPEGEELTKYWLQHPSFGTCEKKILGTLLENEEGLELDELAKASGYAVTGGFRNALSSLRTAGVLVGRNTEVMKPSETLMA